jgi:hypothetical protein
MLSNPFLHPRQRQGECVDLAGVEALLSCFTSTNGGGERGSVRCFRGHRVNVKMYKNKMWIAWLNKNRHTGNY